MGVTGAASRWPRQGRRGRLPSALLVSLLVHGVLLSLSFGDGLGLPGLELPWQKRRVEVPELRVQLVLPTAAPPAEAAPANAVADEAAAPPPDVAPSVAPEPGAAEVHLLSADDVAPPAAVARALLAVPRRDAAFAVPAASAVPTAAVAALSAASGPALESLARPRESLRLRAEPAPDLTAVDALRPAATVGVMAAASSPALETLRRGGESLRLNGERAALDTARVDPAAAIATFGGASAPGLERVRRAAEGLSPRAAGERTAELAQLDAARQQAQQGAQRLEAARLEALRQEAARADAARQEADRAEAARLDALRQEATRREAARQETARQEAAKLAAAQAQARAEEEQREARKRAIGRQLDEEAARRDAERQRPDWTPARRGRLFGRADSNAELVAYGEGWARKIETNLAPETVRDVARQPHADAIVTVAVRSNGSVESVTFVRSSGVPAVDEAITRIVRSQENYPAFPPALLRDYDVVEIRRTWHFDTAVRLY